jgi:hypothetical protein
VNFPDSQLTGSLAEQDLGRLFTSWRWVVGKDHIDIGYDLSVVPDITKFKGARFLVQSKGTTRRKKGSIVAQVSKNRLRQYAENPHPVFIIRVMPDGIMYWLHAQQWAKNNLHKLVGYGNSGVKFEREQTLADRQKFVSYLDKVMAPAHEKIGSLGELSEKRSQYLSAIDPRFRVKANVVDGKESYQVFAATCVEDSVGRFTLIPARKKENIDRLKEAIEFGVPATIEVDEFKLEGSPLFDAIGASRALSGTISMNANSVSSGMVHLYSGAEHSITAAEIGIRANLFSGEKGVVVNNDGFESALKINSRFTAKLSAQNPGSINFTIDRKALSTQALRGARELGEILEWAEQALEKGALRIEMSFRGHRVPLGLQNTGEGLFSFLRGCVLLGRLHVLAKYFDSDILLPEGHEITESEENDISLAYRILRGERCVVRMEVMEFEAADNVEPEGFREVCVRSNIQICVAGHELGSIPVEINIPSCRFEKTVSVNKYKIVPSDTQEATVAFLEGDKPEGLISRA